MTRTHSDISRTLADLGAMARDLTQGAPERVLTVYWNKHAAAEIHLRADAMDALFDVEVDPHATTEDLTALDHHVVAGPEGAHHVSCTYTPQWGCGAVSCRVVAVYAAEPAWLATLLGKDGTPDESLAETLAASVARTGGAK